MRPFLAKMITEAFRSYRAIRAQDAMGPIELGPPVVDQREMDAAIGGGPVCTSAAMEKHLGVAEEHFFGRRTCDTRLHPRWPTG